MPERWRPRQRWGAGLLVATGALVALVAVVADGSPLEAPPSGDRFRIDPSAVIVAFGMVVTAGLVMLGLALWSLAGDRRGWGAPPPRRTWVQVLLALALVGLFLALPDRRPPPGEEVVDSQERPGEPADETDDGRGDPPIWPVVLIGTTFVGAMAAAAWGGRRPRPAPAPASPSQADVIAVRIAFDASIDELLAEPDARRAVIAAYASLLTGLERAGAPRRAAEAPEEHLERALADLDVAPGPLRSLVALFEEARFSTHAMGQPQKAAAVEAFRAAQDSLPSVAVAR